MPLPSFVALIWLPWQTKRQNMIGRCPDITIQLHENCFDENCVIKDMMSSEGSDEGSELESQLD